jgi:hypothetical protein
MKKKREPLLRLTQTQADKILRNKAFCANAKEKASISVAY